MARSESAHGHQATGDQGQKRIKRIRQGVGY